MLLADTPPDDLHKHYDTILRNILDQHAPEKTVTIIFRPNSPWMSDDIVHEKRLWRKVESVWRRTGLQVHREMYVHQRDTVNNMIQKAKVSYYKDKISQCNGDQKALFNIVQTLSKPSADQRSSSSNSYTAADFNQFFMDKVTKCITSLIPVLQHHLIVHSQNQKALSHSKAFTRSPHQTLTLWSRSHHQNHLPLTPGPHGCLRPTSPL